MTSTHGRTRRRAGVVTAAAMALAVAWAPVGADAQDVPGLDATPTASPVSPSPPASPTAGPTPPGVIGPFDVVAQVHRATIRIGDVAWVVTDADGQVLSSRRPRRALLPASTMKVLTAAGAMEVMGPHARMVTTVESPATPDADGVVGSLVVVGGGDPALTTQAYRTHIYPARPSSDIEDLADQVVAAGVTRVEGNIVADATAFGSSELAAGWPPRYLADYDARRISALEVDTGIEVDTAVIDGFDQLVAQRQAEDPPLHAAWELARALQERGVEVGGRVVTRTVPRPPRTRLASVSSPALDTMVQFMLERSDNHFADTLVRTTGLRAEGLGTWSAGGRAVTDSLAALEVETAGLVVDDGSGLSRLDRASPLTLAGADRAMSARFDDAWSDWLSTAGVDGTLSARLAGTPAEGHFHGKTGSLADVRARVGHYVDDDGRRLHMAVIGNDLPSGETWRLTVLADDLAIAMADHLAGCTRVPRPSPPDPDATDGPTATPTARDPGQPLPQVPLSDTSVWRRVCGQS